jgi:hypothetical protein
VGGFLFHVLIISFHKAKFIISQRNLIVEQIINFLFVIFRKPTPMKYFIKLLSIICLLIILSTCKKESKQNPETDYLIYDNGEGTIGAGGGKITLNGNNAQESSVSIDIPAGALAKSELISINVSPDSLSNSTYSLGSLIELKPEGLIFNDSVKLIIKLNSPLNQDDNPIIFQYLPKRSYLKYNETNVDNNNNTIYTNIKHFSLWTYIMHFDLRLLSVQNFQVYIDNYPSKPIQNYYNIFTRTKEDIMRAFSQWDYLTDKSFSLTSNVDEANIALQFTTQTEATDFYGGDPFDGGNASAVAMWYLGDLNKRVILFNDDKTWASTDSIGNNVKTILELPYQLNTEGVEFTALHEIGHLFGLRHQQTEQNFNAVMTPYCPSLFPRTLTCTDLEAFNSQYSNSCAVSLNSIGDLNIVSEPGSILKDGIVVKVKDVNGNGVPGVTVMFYNDSNISMEFTKYTSTNIEGNAYLSEMHVPQSEGKINIIVYAYLSNGMKYITYTVNNFSSLVLLKQWDFSNRYNDIDPITHYYHRLAYDGSILWTSEYNNVNDNTSKLIELNLDESLSIKTTISDPTGFRSQSGLAWDGNNLWSCDYNPKKIYKHSNDQNLTVLEEYTSPAYFPYALVWDGRYLWCYDFQDNTIYKLDTNGALLNSYKVEGFGGPNEGILTDLTWDGSSLWAVAWYSDRIYKCGIIDGIFKPVKEYHVYLNYRVGIEWVNGFLYVLNLNYWGQGKSGMDKYELKE